MGLIMRMVISCCINSSAGVHCALSMCISKQFSDLKSFFHSRILFLKTWKDADATDGDNPVVSGPRLWLVQCVSSHVWHQCVSSTHFQISSHSCIGCTWKISSIGSLVVTNVCSHIIDSPGYIGQWSQQQYWHHSIWNQFAVNIKTT